MHYLFSDMVPVPAIKQLLVSLYSSCGISAELINMDGLVVVSTSGQNTFERLSQYDYPSAQLDWQIDAEYCPLQSQEFLKRYKLSHVFFKYGRNICVEKQDVATLLVGPVFHTSPKEDDFRRLGQEFGWDEAAGLEASRQTPIVSQAQAEGYVELLVQLIQSLAEKGLNELRLTEKLAAGQEYLAKQQRTHAELEARLRERSEELERVNAALRDSERRFQVALTGTPIVVFNQDLDLRYTWIYNPQNYAGQPVIGKTDADLFNPEDALHLTVLKERVIAAGLLTRDDVALTLEGTTFHYDITLDPLYDVNGAVTGLTGAATDITERKQIEEELRRRLAESEGIQKITKGLLQKIGLDEVLKIVCAQAMQLTRAEGSAVLLLDEGGWLRLTHRAGLPVYNLDHLPVKGSFAGLAVQTGEHVWVNRQKDASNEPPDQWQGYPWTPGLLSMLSVPLKVDQQPIGVLNILNKPGEITQEDIRIINLFADQAAMIIEHVRLQHQAEQFAVLAERQRLARDLHDSVTQALYSVALYADAAHLAFSRKHWEALQRNLHELRSMAREAMLDMRLLLFELRPFMLETEGVATALRTRLAAVEGRTGLKTKLAVEAERRLPVGIEEEIFRIALEGLNNVVKHAKASEVQIRLEYDPSSVSLDICDDGLGFDPKMASESGGLGLRGIQERVQRLKGSVEIVSASGQGTRLIVQIPISEMDSMSSDEQEARSQI